LPTIVNLVESMHGDDSVKHNLMPQGCFRIVDPSMIAYGVPTRIFGEMGVQDMPPRVLKPDEEVTQNALTVGC